MYNIIKDSPRSSA